MCAHGEIRWVRGAPPAGRGLGGPGGEGAWQESVLCGGDRNARSPEPAACWLRPAAVRAGTSGGRRSAGGGVPQARGVAGRVRGVVRWAPASLGGGGATGRLGAQHRRPGSLPSAPQTVPTDRAGAPGPATLPLPFPVGSHQIRHWVLLLSPLTRSCSRDADQWPKIPPTFSRASVGAPTSPPGFTPGPP